MGKDYNDIEQSVERLCAGARKRLWLAQIIAMTTQPPDRERLVENMLKTGKAG